MPFWILNKKNNTPAICGSVVAVMEITGVSKNTLYNYFSRESLLEFENDNYRVVKLPLIRAKKP